MDKFQPVREARRAYLELSAECAEASRSLGKRAFEHRKEAEAKIVADRRQVESLKAQKLAAYRDLANALKELGYEPDETPDVEALPEYVEGDNTLKTHPGYPGIGQAIPAVADGKMHEVSLGTETTPVDPTIDTSDADPAPEDELPPDVKPKKAAKKPTKST